MDKPDSFESFYDSAQLSDIQICFSGRKIRAHQVIVCSRSKWFDNARAVGMKEAATGSITLADDDPDAVESMLEFCYGMDYLGRNEKYKTEDPECVYHLTTLYITADKYLVPSLQSHVLAQLTALLTPRAPQPYYFKDPAHCSSFIKVIGLVTEFLPQNSDPLKDFVLALASERPNAERLWEAQEQEFADLLEQFDDLASVLLKRMLKRGLDSRGGGGGIGENYPRTISERKAMLHWN